MTHGVVDLIIGSSRRATAATFDRLNPITGEIATRAAAATTADAAASADAAAASPGNFANEARAALSPQ